MAFFPNHASASSTITSTTQQPIHARGYSSPSSMAVAAIYTSLTSGMNFPLQIPPRTCEALRAADGCGDAFICSKNTYGCFSLEGAIKTIGTMPEHGNPVPNSIFYKLVQKCIVENDPVGGRQVHHKLMEGGLDSDSFLGSHLIRMFASFESLGEVNEVFKKITQPTVFAWSANISAHAKLGHHHEAIELYTEMLTSGVQPDEYVFVSVAQACASIGTPKQGQMVHADIVRTGLESRLFVGNTLINMYASCDRLQDACILFDRLPEQDIVTWNVMIGSYGHHGSPEKALQLCEQMLEHGMAPNIISFFCCVKACACHAALDQGKKAHIFMTIFGFDTNLDAMDALIVLYSECGSLFDARALFDWHPKQDVKTWGRMIASYVQYGQSKEAIQLFKDMQQEGKVASVEMYVCILQACSDLPNLEEGREVHSLIVESGVEFDIFIGNTLVDFYGKCGSLADAQLVFERLPCPDIVTWTALITIYVLHGLNQEAMEAFHKLQQNGLQPNLVTYVCVLKACSFTADLEKGVLFHTQIINNGLELDNIVGSALVDMYVKCGNLEDAFVVFDKLQERDIVLWSVLIAGYTQHGRLQEALRCFRQLQDDGMKPSMVTFVELLNACSLTSAFEHAKEIHSLVVQRGAELDIFVGSALIDTYSNCGSLLEARAVFDSMLRRDVVTWSTMIGALAQHNDYKEALKIFEAMAQEGVRPNEVTFTCLLSACCHVGLVNEGCQHFWSMREEHGIFPGLEHYYSLVDLLGRGGHFEEAEDLLESTPLHSTVVGWMSSLVSCKMYGNVSLGRRCFENLIKLEPGYSSAYFFMMSIYLSAAMVEEAEKVKELSRKGNAWKKPAKAFIEVGGQVHEFVVGDKSHLHSDDIYLKVNDLNNQIKEEGHLPCVDILLGKDNGAVSSGHSEKVASFASQPACLSHL